MESTTLKPPSWLPFDHKLYRLCETEGLSQCPVLICVSGGVDSIALLHSLAQLRGALRLSLVALYVHHGLHENRDHRHMARELVREQSRQLKIPFVSNGELPTEHLSSEQSLREFRQQVIGQMLEHLRPMYKKEFVIAQGHNLDELTETRIMRLIRGTGAEGLEAMATFKNQIFRPFLQISKSELADYCKERKLKYLEDPTNEQIHALRNWLRHEWLPRLEEKVPGGVSALGRSLSHLSGPSSGQENLAEIIVDGAIMVPKLIELTEKAKKQVLAHYMREKTMKNYTTNHINEVLKRLDSSNKEHRFTLLQHDWEICSSWIKAQPLGRRANPFVTMN